MEKESIEKILKETVEELLVKMGFSAEVTVEKSADQENLICNIDTEESNFLIGQYGVNLQSLQHITRLLMRKRTPEKAKFILDVNWYRREKNSSLVKMAKEMAEQALREKRAVVLRPMSAYERRIVHVELSKDLRIKTESIGEGENRKVVIKPVDLI